MTFSLKQSDSPPTASTQHQTVRDLLEASLECAPYPAPWKGRYTFAFADPAFSHFLVRIGVDEQREALRNTTSLTPPEFLFHGPHTGAILLEGRNKKDQHDPPNTFSIVLKQEGKALEDIEAVHGATGIVQRLARHPEKIERFFRTAAFLGVQQETSEQRGFWGNRRIDIHGGNLFLDEEGNPSFIDQMSPEDRKTYVNPGQLDFEKAYNSVKFLSQWLRSYLRDTPDIAPSSLASLTQAIEQSCSHVQTILTRAEKEKDPFTYLKTQLSDPDKAEWRGVIPSDSLCFNHVHSVSANRIDLDTASPQSLLDLLNAMREQTLSR